MKFALPIFALALTLTACGGGGGGSTGGGLVPVTNPSPAPTSPTTPQSVTVSGTVAQMTGSLSSQVWNLAAPTGCNTATCASYPTPPPTLPNASAAPSAGAGVPGATIYAVANADVPGVPATPLATATTAPNGSFTISVPTGYANVGLIALYGASFNAQTGASDTGYTLAHATVAPGASNVTLYVDALSPDEQSAFTALNGDRVNAGLQPLTSDTLAQADARLAVAQQPGAATCDNPATVASFTTYATWGGVGTHGDSWGDTDGPNWSRIIEYGSSWNQAFNFVGLAALYGAAHCGANTNPGGYNYFEGIFIS